MKAWHFRILFWNFSFWVSLKDPLFLKTLFILMDLNDVGRLQKFLDLLPFKHLPRITWNVDEVTGEI